MAEEKKLEDMTLEEAWRVLEERAVCSTCSKCFASSNNWAGVDCGGVSRYAVKMIKDTFNGIESTWKESEMDKQEAPTEPFYQQTVDFMKKSGYKKCYMCGSELE